MDYLWDKSSSGATFTEGNCVAWNGSLWVAGGTGGPSAILTSPNGLDWTPAIGANFTVVYDVAWNGYLWVAVGQNVTGKIATSPDGKNWTMSTQTTFGISGNCVAWNGEIWLIGGLGGAQFYTSSDAITWTAGNTGFTFISTRGPSALAWNGALWVAVGNGINPDTGTTGGNTVLNSIDGKAWAGPQGSVFGGGVGGDVAWNGSLWVAVGDGRFGASDIITSIDGKTWTNTSVNASNNIALTSIIWTGSLWIATGGNNLSSPDRVYTSPDGIAWTGTSYVGRYPSGGYFGGGYAKSMASQNAWKSAPSSIIDRVKNLESIVLALNGNVVY